MFLLVYKHFHLHPFKFKFLLVYGVEKLGSHGNLEPNGNFHTFPSKGFSRPFFAFPALSEYFIALDFDFKIVPV